MAKTSVQHRCSECGWTSPVWVGRCRECQAWGSLSEVSPLAGSTTKAVAPSSAAVRINDVPAEEARAIATGMPELDRVLGDGLVPGGVVLLAGEPGVGKSTLLLEVASQWAKNGRRTLYVSAEESAPQVRRRADRTGAICDELFLAAECDLGTILGHVEQLDPSLLVLDSVQTVSTGGDGTPGGVTQIREVTNALVRTAKRRGLTILIIGHVTKDGAVAGPRLLEHMVDVVLSFEGERTSGLRLVRASKNRFGPADEVGCFELTERGIEQVLDPSGLFMSTPEMPEPGTCVTVTMEGRRPLLTEVQALVAPSATPNPRRVTHGVDGGRISMALAVLQRRAGLKTHNKDVYVSTVGGVKVSDPAADLAVAVAIASAANDWYPTARIIALGEVGLSGELRRVPGVGRRLAEAERLGFEVAVVPRGSEVKTVGRLQVRQAATVAEALDAIWSHHVNHNPNVKQLRAWRSA